GIGPWIIDSAVRRVGEDDCRQVIRASRLNVGGLPRSWRSTPMCSLRIVGEVLGPAPACVTSGLRSSTPRCPAQPMYPMRKPSQGYVLVKKMLSCGWRPTAEIHIWYALLFGTPPCRRRHTRLAGAPGGGDVIVSVHSTALPP